MQDFKDDYYSFQEGVKRLDDAVKGNLAHADSIVRPSKPCTCSHSAVTRYQKCISGPMLDRIDIHIEVPLVDYEKLSDNRRGCFAIVR